uniref:NADH-ubiquinone oxidoreductase chain 6 n=1 Tax=Brachythemis contaminata TaxID=342759 RepID=A0A0U1YT61_BRACT|nr:NADH dehydrogenase subunit 6 [Brachythemis contaminata]AJE75786.1 NADH dehydrogenase subunit 6 [Brachythemis contaminata]
MLSMITLIMNSLLFSSMNHPMNMGLMLLIQTLLMSLFTATMSYSSWFSYILFLVFLGGMLVLFIYMTSIASNEFFKKSKITLMLITTTLAIIMMTTLIDPMMTSLPSNQESFILTENMKMVMTPLYNNPNSIITTFMVLYLFLTLIIVVYITKFNKGPLRPTN